MIEEKQSRPGGRTHCPLLAVLLAALVVLALGACSSTVGESDQPEQTAPTSTPAQPAPSNTAPPLPRLTPSPTPAATHTRVATPTVSPTPTATPGPRVWGVEMNKALPERGLGLAQQARVYWLRNNGLLWSVVEPTPGARRWGQVGGLEAELRATYEAGLQTILIVRGAPEWARQVPGVECSAVRPEALEAMAAFVADAVARYQNPPYGVKYWELGNEPDVDPRLVSPDSPFGCWGDMDDAFYGGGYYARMLQVVYPAIKAADPEAQVLIGGLLLDQDPAHDDKTNPPGHFLEGVLRGGGGDSFDGVSFHAYLGYDGQLHDWEMRPGGWQGRGGTVAGKVDLIREVLGRYGLHKPLFLTEGGLLCWECTEPLPPGFADAQAAYVPRLYLRSVGLGLTAALWYTLDGPGWHQAGLLDGDQRPRPAYEALITMTSLLDRADYLGPLEGPPGSEGYRFAQATGGEVWAVWSRDGVALSLPLPQSLQRAVDHLGAPIEVDGDRLDVGFEPIYLILGNGN